MLQLLLSLPLLMALLYFLFFVAAVVPAMALALALELALLLLLRNSSSSSEFFFFFFSSSSSSFFFHICRGFLLLFILSSGHSYHFLAEGKNHQPVPVSRCSRRLPSLATRSGMGKRTCQVALGCIRSKSVSCICGNGNQRFRP